MNIQNVRIKETTDEMIVEAIDFIANSCFINGTYNPYYRGIAEKIAVVKIFIDGIEYEEGNSLFVAAEVPEVKRLVSRFFAVDAKLYDETKVMMVIRENVNELIEYRKQRLIHGADALEYIASAVKEIKDFISDLDVALGNLVNLDLSNLTPEDIEQGKTLIGKLNNAGVELNKENVSEIIKNAVNFDTDKASQEIIDAKNAEIIDLKAKIKELEKGSDGE